MKCCAAAAGLDPAIVSGHSLRLGFVTSALEHGADIFKVMDQRRVETFKDVTGGTKRFGITRGSGFCDEMMSHARRPFGPGPRKEIIRLSAG
jgi:hypothetical protein